MKKIIKFLVCAVALSGCAGNAQNKSTASENPPQEIRTAETLLAVRHFAGAFSNGMKGDSIFFDISADGKRLENLTFKGYWRCSGKLEQTEVGPEGNFNNRNGKVKGHVTEPPNGGSTAWRFELDAAIKPTAASGTFRMNINNLGCDTYLLKWTAAPVKQ